MATPLEPGQVAALREERGRIAAYLSVVPPAQAAHPSVTNARVRLQEIDRALAASEERARKLSKKMRKQLPQLIDQVAGVNPVIAGHMKAALAGKLDARTALMQFAGKQAATAYPQFAPLLPMLGALMADDDNEED